MSPFHNTIPQLLFTLSIVSVLGLDAIEGEVVTLTCPKRSRTLPVVWEGPPDFAHFTKGRDVDLRLPAEIRSRVSVIGDHDLGYYNLQIDNVKKSDTGIYRCLVGSRMQRQIRVLIQTEGTF